MNKIKPELSFDQYTLRITIVIIYQQQSLTLSYDMMKDTVYSRNLSITVNC